MIRAFKRWYLRMQIASMYQAYATTQVDIKLAQKHLSVLQNRLYKAERELVKLL